VGDGLYLVFRDNAQAQTPYRVCWKRVGHPAKRCWYRATGPAGQKSRIFTAAPGHVGTYRVRWKAEGLIVAHWSFYNGVGD
jgi:hypothetical protein